VSRASSLRGLASCHRVGTCTHLLMTNRFLSLAPRTDTRVQIDGLPSCILTHADKRHSYIYIDVRSPIDCCDS